MPGSHAALYSPDPVEPRAAACYRVGGVVDAAFKTERQLT
jgi:hypothetical protein